MREPAFWWRKAGAAALLLSPLGAIYGAVAASRMARQGARAGIPVICVGNFTLGGAGKTPTAIAIARMLTDAGERPAIISRGYGGAENQLYRIEIQHPGTTPNFAFSRDVGDEALLLARAAPTIVCPDRVAGAQAAKAGGATVIVMDDGLQNPSLAKDLTIAVVDGRRGIGNGLVFPVGPLRAPLSSQWPQVGALLIVGESSSAAPLEAEAKARNIPVFHATLEPDRAAIDALGGRKVLAFAGIGDPDKFFATVAAAGIDAPLRKAFADHHRFTAAEAGELIMQAEHEGLRLLTTEKDHARMHGDPALAALASRAHVLPVTLKVQEDSQWRALLPATARR